jgi:hypothetical protein
VADVALALWREFLDVAPKRAVACRSGSVRTSVEHDAT